ncbi:hypothetical protein A8C56_15265 [Niabella ginsenosidivorans]|uniref:Uncharacterized protein n=1 Tax=Niabella ginsenosidivorans TaxID=1176587 RepID=A0A1A9I3A0_9BACT|nr:hypothetical protein [Niabella ginsenosidivorans]ANH82147.1 hypothetical protein A8C56_15265 [Niabella ginsenosidivorans]
MSSQHKLYDYQVTPPAEVWNSIATGLDEWQQLKPLAQKLNAMEVAPPDLAWKNILDNLEEENAFDHLSDRLKHFEIPPPAALWSKIEPELPRAVAAPKLAPVKKGSFKWARYAVAATVVGLLCFATFHMIEKSNKDSATILSRFENTDRKNDQQIASLDRKEKEPVKQVQPLAAHPSVLPDAHTQPTQIKTASGNTYITTVERNKALQGRYIMLMTEDGKVVRMSKKLGNIADCVAGEASGSECSNQIQQWQKQLAKAPVTATPDTFLDLLDLASSDKSGL